MAFPHWVNPRSTWKGRYWKESCKKKPKGIDRTGQRNISKGKRGEESGIKTGNYGPQRRNDSGPRKDERRPLDAGLENLKKEVGTRCTKKGPWETKSDTQTYTSQNHFRGKHAEITARPYASTAETLLYISGEAVGGKS